MPTRENDLILKQYKVMVDMIGLVFKDSVEVVLHSLEDMEKSVIYIHNGKKTSRRLGSPVTDKALRILAEFKRSKHTLYGPYRTVSFDGHTMKSVTTVITNSKGEAIGLLCINFDLATPLNEIFKILCDDFEVANVAKATSSDAANCNSNSLSSDETAATAAAAAAAASLTPTAISHLLGGLNDSANNNGTGKGSGDSNNFSVSTEKGGNAGSGTATGNEQTWEGSEYFASDIHDLLNTSVNQTRRQILNDDSIPQRQKNKAIIQELQKQGLFNLRNAVPIISEILNLSRDAIYLHLRACKK